MTEQEKRMRDFTDREHKKTIERRIVEGKNGKRYVQVRFVPIESWEPNEGWRTAKAI